MKKPFSEHAIYVFDVDGTLYDSRPVRLILGLRLLLFGLLHPLRLDEIRALWTFRRVYERIPAGSLPRDQYQATVRQTGLDEEALRRVIGEWMIRRPLPLIRRFRSRRVLDVLRQLRARGKRIVVHSDYPAEEKLQALGVCPDFTLTASDVEHCPFKPDPAGLLALMRREGWNPEDVIVIGDRDDRDGACARAADVAYLILDRTPRGREARRQLAAFARQEDRS